MTQRERFLSIIVGGLLLAAAAYWGLTKFQEAKRTRQNRITALEGKTVTINETLFQGGLADRQMGEYLRRSLPSDPETALSDYSNWLLSLGNQVGLQNLEVSRGQDIPVQDLYRRYPFDLSGTGDMPTILNFLRDFYAKDYLHRISYLNLTPSTQGGIKLDLKIDAVGFNAAPADAEPPGSDSWRVTSDVAADQQAILNRNFFEPPNQPPQFKGKETVEGIVGSKSTAKLPFEDAEGHDLTFEIAGDPLDFVELDQSSGELKLNPTETGDFQLLVRAIDQGYPSRTAEQLVKVKVSDPPPPKKEPEPEPEFDDARQTTLTGLVEGRNGWVVWLNVRTRGKLLKLREGDQFEIGTVNGKVVEITNRYAELEVDEKRLKLRHGGNLGEAVKQSEED